MMKGFTNLQGLLRRPPALRTAQASRPVVEALSPAWAVAPGVPQSPFWQFTLRTVPIVGVFLATSMLAVLSTQHSQAQQQLTPKAPEQGSPKQNEPKQPPVQLSIPSDDRLVMMIRSTLMALNQADATGDYTVFREMAAPAFQESNSPARLTEIFTNLRRRNLDLSPVLLFQPKLFRKPEINANGMLRITGFFPTAPEQVNFDLIFQPVQGRWRLFGIAADTSRGQPTLQLPAEPAEVVPSPQAAKPAAPARETGSDASGTTAKPADSQVDIQDRIDRR
jgi:hypothetical protein